MDYNYKHTARRLFKQRRAVYAYMKHKQKRCFYCLLPLCRRVFRQGIFHSGAKAAGTANVVYSQTGWCLAIAYIYRGYAFAG